MFQMPDYSSPPIACLNTRETAGDVREQQQVVAVEIGAKARNGRSFQLPGAPPESQWIVNGVWGDENMSLHYLSANNNRP